MWASGTGALAAEEREFVMLGQYEERQWAVLVASLAACLSLAACQPTVRVEAPKEPITINLNVKLDAEVKVKLEEQADKDIESNPDIF